MIDLEQIAARSAGGSSRTRELVISVLISTLSGFFFSVFYWGSIDGIPNGIIVRLSVMGGLSMAGISLIVMSAINLARIAESLRR
jgi:hypothetical protein